MISDSELLVHTKRVSFELSNQCNLACVHRECPLSLESDVKMLPTKVVIDVLKTLKRHGFAGEVAWHTYNEPLCDPRLTYLIRRARRLCPKAGQYLSTNGIMLTQRKLDKLAAAGLTRIHVSAYTKKVFDRVSDLDFPIKHVVGRGRLIKNHLQIYNLPENDCDAPCQAPLGEIIISRDANILLCCREWQRRHTFGDLTQQPFESLLRSGVLHEVHARLSKGDRYLYLCRRCDWSR
jgi:MoaA/NifB/PqqE/SkfB family radical SAM enzyme